MRKRKLCKKGLALVLTCALITGLLPVAGVPKEVQAETAAEKNIAGLGTSVIADPVNPASGEYDDSKGWQGSYVYYGNYDADGTAEPVKYRVLDASTTRFSAEDSDGNKATTMLLDCDSILFKRIFDDSSNVWADSDVKNSLNGDGFLNKEGVFTTAEKNAIAKSNVDTHVLTTDSATGVNVAGGTKDVFVNYVALDGEQIFLLDAEDVSNGAYGYSMTNTGCENRKKEGSSAAYWWLRSADYNMGFYAGFVHSDGSIYYDYVDSDYPGVSPALNLNLSSSHLSSLELPGRQAQSIS